jgi:phosphopantothenoylcysteine decarboxylase/phosphopantothenate--cysteine ligase
MEVIRVESAAEMAEAVWARAGDSDVAVLAAAVADFRPVDPAGSKLRRSDGAPDFDLEPTPDILAGVAAMEPRPFLVGFAAETGSLDGAVDKARRKGVDLLVGNDVAEKGSGFGSDTNRVVVITPDGSTEPWDLMAKRDVAERLWDRIVSLHPGPGAAVQGRVGH